MENALSLAGGEREEGAEGSKKVQKTGVQQLRLELRTCKRKTHLHKGKGAYTTRREDGRGTPPKAAPLGEEAYPLDHLPLTCWMEVGATFAIHTLLFLEGRSPKLLAEGGCSLLVFFRSGVPVVLTLRAQPHHSLALRLRLPTTDAPVYHASWLMVFMG